MPNDVDVETTDWRSAVYRWLSASFLAGSEPARVLDLRGLAGAAEELSRCAPPPFRGLEGPFLRAGESLRRATQASLASEHASRFGHAVSKECPPYETLYGSGQVDFQQSQVMADIAGFLKAFGLRISPGRERVDHVAAELEFMHALTAKEAHALLRGEADNLGITRDAASRFLAEHLGRWGTTLGGNLARGGDGFYARWGGLLKAFLEADAAHLGVGPLDPARVIGEAPAPEGPMSCLASPDVPGA